MKDKTHKEVKDSKKKDWVKPELVVLGLRDTQSGTHLAVNEASVPAFSRGTYSPSGDRIPRIPI